MLSSEELSSLWERIQAAAERFIAVARRCGPEATYHDLALKHCHDELSGYLSVPLDEAEVTQVERLEGFSQLVPLLRDLNAWLHQVTEVKEARRLLEQGVSDFDAEVLWVTAGFRETLSGQITQWNRCGLLPDDKSRPIYVVGGGALPQTQAYLHRLTGRRVVTVEKHGDAAEAAIAFIESQNLGEMLPVLHADGRLVSYSNAAAVVVATLVPEKTEVATQVAKTAPMDVVLNLRDPVGLHSIWRKKVDHEALQAGGWELRDTLRLSGAALQNHLFTLARLGGNKV